MQLLLLPLLLTIDREKRVAFISPKYELPGKCRGHLRASRLDTPPRPLRDYLANRLLTPCFQEFNPSLFGNLIGCFSEV